MGIFSGSGVGKSTLLAMLARNTDADAIVIALVGERGREVKEFIEDDLGAEGLARSVVVAATSDEPPLVRRQAAYVAMAVAEQLRDQGLHVLLLMDSVTRFAMAQREIGLSAGEPPATKGYTPTVFAELPRLLERAGPGAEGRRVPSPACSRCSSKATITTSRLPTPCAASWTATLCWNVHIAERGRFPAINILKSVSRAMPGCNTPRSRRIVARARAPLAIYEDMAELIRLGAYKTGTNAEVDAAIKLYPQLEAFLAQKKDERATFTEGYAALEKIVGGNGKGKVHETPRYTDPPEALPRRRPEAPHGDARRHEGRCSSASSPISRTAWRARRQRASDSDIGRLAFPSFLRSIETRRENLRATLKEIERERDQAQDDLTGAFQDLKSLEFATEQQAKRVAEIETRRSQSRLDEMALVRHLRKHALRRA